MGTSPGGSLLFDQTKGGSDDELRNLLNEAEDMKSGTNPSLIRCVCVCVVCVCVVVGGGGERTGMADATTATVNATRSRFFYPHSLLVHTRDTPLGIRLAAVRGNICKERMFAEQSALPSTRPSNTTNTPRASSPPRRDLDLPHAHSRPVQPHANLTPTLPP